jgi:phosphopantetheine adenylyltransferase
MINYDQSVYDELNGKVEGEKVEITLLNGDVIVGENIIIGVDSTSWVEEREIRDFRTYKTRIEFVKRSVSTWNIKQIDVAEIVGKEQKVVYIMDF